MATLEELAKKGVIYRQRIKLASNEFDDRLMYGTPEFKSYLGSVLKEVPFYATNAPPRYQAQSLIKDFITGKPFRETRLFKRMRPNSNDVYELRSDDLRFFGWFPRMDVFVAVRGDTFTNLKNDLTLYELHRIATLDFRNAIDLDEPKYEPGAGEFGVISR